MSKGTAQTASIIVLLFALALVSCSGTTGSTQLPASTPQMGPLVVSSGNPRYFADPNGKAVYLTGSHFHEDGELNLTDFGSYLSFLQQENHNFVRLWHWEQDAPGPYPRTGPGTALDGQPKYDLSQFNQPYFDTLRARVQAAQASGIYVGVMLFNGWSIATHDPTFSNPWPKHPFNASNNINGINGDPDGDGLGEEVHTLLVPAVTALQDAYARKVVDTLNDLDNIIWEISNESDKNSTAWQYHMIDLLHSYEATKPKRHPVWMSVEWPDGSNDVLFASNAQAISPNNSSGDYIAEGSGPVANGGSKIILGDTDHLFGEGGSAGWVWKSFARGINPIFLDDQVRPLVPDGQSIWAPVRKAMGRTRAYALRMNLIQMIPRGDLASTGYCLANPGHEYLVYIPSGGTATLDLSNAIGTFTVEWFEPDTGTTISGGAVTGGASQSFTAPFQTSAALYLLRR